MYDVYKSCFANCKTTFSIKAEKIETPFGNMSVFVHNSAHWGSPEMSKTEHSFAFRIESQIHWMCLRHWHCVWISLSEKETEQKWQREQHIFTHTVEYRGNRDTHSTPCSLHRHVGNKSAGSSIKCPRQQEKKNSRNPASEPTPPPTLGLGAGNGRTLVSWN